MGVGDAAPTPMAIARELPPMTGMAKLMDIEAVYGFRHATACAGLHMPAPHTLTLSLVFLFLHRSVDPTRMTERERRNLVLEEDLYAEFEVLVYGHFHEDDNDNGFKATRWVAWSEVEQADEGDGADEAFRLLNGFLESAKAMLIHDAGS